MLLYISVSVIMISWRHYFSFSCVDNRQYKIGRKKKKERCDTWKAEKHLNSKIICRQWLNCFPDSCLIHQGGENKHDNAKRADPQMNATAAEMKTNRCKSVRRRRCLVAEKRNMKNIHFIWATKENWMMLNNTIFYLVRCLFPLLSQLLFFLISFF